MTDRYDTDFVLWSEQQAALLRRMAVGLPINAAPDWDNIAEEIESLGKSDRRELINRIVVLLDHLMRLASPAHDPRRGWRSTVAEQRRRIAQLLNAKWAARSQRPCPRHARPAVWRWRNTASNRRCRWIRWSSPRSRCWLPTSGRRRRDDRPVAAAASKLFLARLEAIDVILAGADPHGVRMVCVHVLAAAGTWML